MVWTADLPTVPVVVVYMFEKGLRARSREMMVIRQEVVIDMTTGRFAARVLRNDEQD